MIDVEPLFVEETDTDVARCKVTTTNAVGETREYEVGLDPTHSVDGAIVQSGRRVDENAPDESAGGGVPSSAFDAAREHFESEGFEVF